MDESLDQTNIKNEEVELVRKKLVNLTQMVKSRTNPLELEFKITSFKQLGLTDPLHPTSSFASVLKFLNALEFEKPIYCVPKATVPPRCIFVPNTHMLQ